MDWDWSYILKDSIKDGKIREIHLKNIPVLKDCEHWEDVKEIGLVDHETKYAHYNGMLVWYGSRIYYITRRKMEALSPYRKWDKRNRVEVTDIAKKKKR